MGGVALYKGKGEHGAGGGGAPHAPHLHPYGEDDNIGRWCWVAAVDGPAAGLLRLLLGERPELLHTACFDLPEISQYQNWKKERRKKERREKKRGRRFEKKNRFVKIIF